MIDPRPTRVICDQCGARAWIDAGDQQRRCTDCDGPFRPLGALEGLVDRWFAPPAQHVAEFYPRHLKLIELLWTTRGRGRDTYAALQLKKVSYAQFLSRATPIVVRGLSEGWIAARIPAAPTMDDSAYEIQFHDPNRWADELLQAFPSSNASPGVEASRLDSEGDGEAISSA